MKTLRVVIMAKAPLPGFAKTRLIPLLGPDGAALLANRMLRHAVESALRADIGPVELCVTPGTHETVWRELTHAGISLSGQGDGTLGDRLARVAKRVISAGESVLLMGTDCPALDASRLKEAAALLQDADATLFPTADGGYALLGLHCYHHALFAHIPWSTDAVAFETVSRVARLGWSVRYGPILHDIDEPADLKWLPRGWIEALNA